MKAQKLRGREEILSARIVPILVFATLLLSAPLAKAVPITIEITGEVTSVSGSGLPDTIYEGFTFTGTYTYDSSTSDSDSDPQRGLYLHDSPYGISILLGDYEFKTAPSHMDQFEMGIINDDPVNGLHDYYAVFSDENVSPSHPSFNISSIRWDLSDSTYDAISSDALPTTAPLLSAWDYNYLEIYGGNSQGGLYIGGTVTQAVPEPMTSIILVVGCFILRGRRKIKALN